MMIFLVTEALTDTVLMMFLIHLVLLLLLLTELRQHVNTNVLPQLVMPA